MTRFYILLIRLFLAAFFAVLLSRFFYPNASVLAIVAIGAFLVGMAYVMERFHKREKGPEGKADL